MKKQNLKRNRLNGSLLSFSINLLALAALFLFIASCSSEEEPSRQDSAQSSDQKQAVKQEISDQTEEVQQHIKAAVDQIVSSKELKIGNRWLAEVSVIPVFYERRQYRPVWTQPAKIKDLMRAIENIKEDGLLPEDYHRRQLQALSEQIDAQSPPDPRLLAMRDLLLTDALVLLGYHLQIGKVDPVRLDPNWNMSAKIGSKDPVTLTQEAIDSGSIYQFFTDLRPRDEYYNYLKATLSQYYSIQDGGGWQPIPQGATLKKGVEHQRVDMLRNRLTTTGDLVSTPEGPGTRFDDDLEEAVKHFQRRRGLKPDGVVGKNTIKALNVPDKVIIDQIRINLERVRWVMREDLEEFIFVNIPSFEVYYVRDEKIKWSARAQVGKPFRQTPIFGAKMTHLEFNPTWTIPPTILTEDILPAIKRDPGYLQKHNIQVIDKKGKVIASESVNWSSYSGKNFPFQLRQKPGPDNALGRVKFMFPNEHAVYLHDTPSKKLFGKESRAFSSGCIRIENPLELAQLLLPKGWDQNRIQQTIQSKKTRAVKLARPMPVIMFYLTALPAPDGEFHALEDIYNRDQAVLEELNAEFKSNKKSAKSE
jgi:murein L,D-transpeptidase YcbB/YkuD